MNEDVVFEVNKILYSKCPEVSCFISSDVTGQNVQKKGYSTLEILVWIH